MLVALALDSFCFQIEHLLYNGWSFHRWQRIQINTVIIHAALAMKQAKWMNGTKQNCLKSKWKHQFMRQEISNVMEFIRWMHVHNHNGANSFQMRWYGPLESIFLVNIPKNNREYRNSIFIPWLCQQWAVVLLESFVEKGNEFPFVMLSTIASHDIQVPAYIAKELSLVDYLFKSIFHLFDLSLILQRKE